MRKHYQVLPFFFSLGLHGLLAGFLLLISEKVMKKEPFAIEVLWEEVVKPQTVIASDPPLGRGVVDHKVKKDPSPDLSLCKRSTSPTRGEVAQEQKPSPLVGEGAPKGRVRGISSTSLKRSVKKSYHPMPKYPWVCRKRGQEGSVSLLVQINKEGRVIRASLHKSSGYASLDESALNIVKTWVFSDSASQKILSFAFRLKG